MFLVNRLSGYFFGSRLSLPTQMDLSTTPYHSTISSASSSSNSIESPTSYSKIRPITRFPSSPTVPTQESFPRLSLNAASVTAEPNPLASSAVSFSPISSTSTSMSSTTTTSSSSTFLPDSQQPSPISETFTNPSTSVSSSTTGKQKNNSRKRERESDNMMEIDDDIFDHSNLSTSSTASIADSMSTLSISRFEQIKAERTAKAEQLKQSLLASTIASVHSSTFAAASRRKGRIGLKQQKMKYVYQHPAHSQQLHLKPLHFQLSSQPNMENMHQLPLQEQQPVNRSQNVREDQHERKRMKKQSLGNQTPLVGQENMEIPAPAPRQTRRSKWFDVTELTSSSLHPQPMTAVRESVKSDPRKQVAEASKKRNLEIQARRKATRDAAMRARRFRNPPQQEQSDVELATEAPSFQIHYETISHSIEITQPQSEMQYQQPQPPEQQSESQPPQQRCHSLRRSKRFHPASSPSSSKKNLSPTVTSSASASSAASTPISSPLAHTIRPRRLTRSVMKNQSNGKEKEGQKEEEQEKEIENEKEREKEKEKERNQEKQREAIALKVRELERQRERQEREMEKAREREKEKERERAIAAAKEREKEEERNLKELLQPQIELKIKQRARGKDYASLLREFCPNLYEEAAKKKRDNQRDMRRSICLDPNTLHKCLRRGMASFHPDKAVMLSIKQKIEYSEIFAVLNKAYDELSDIIR